MDHTSLFASESTLDISRNDSSSILNLIEERIKYYNAENEKLEEIFHKLHIINKELQTSENLNTSIGKLMELKAKYQIENLTTNSLLLANVNKRIKQNDYLSRVKLSIKIYMNLNESLSKTNKKLREDSDLSKSKLEAILRHSIDELKAMEEKIKIYENELLKFEKKYPWLKDSLLDLPNIMTEVNTLTNLKMEKEELEKELNVYKGLKPDLREASQQLNQIKIECQEINSKIFK